MYSDEELNDAVKVGIFDAHSVNEFRQHITQVRNTHQIDEENFRLLSGFNDIFVIIASALLLASMTWLSHTYSEMLGAAVLATGSWGLAEVFVRRKRMALPAIGLLLSFLVGVFSIPLSFGPPISEIHLVSAVILTTIGAWLHWQRFRVPITLAAGVVALILGVGGVIFIQFTDLRFFHQPFLAIAGLGTFALAMYWDAKDPKRQSRNSDIAFWLHLLSAPMIVHPIFSSLGILSGNSDISTAALVLGLYMVLALISIIVDRRAIMVSALIYVIYALSGLLETYGFVSYSMAVTGVFLGGSLLVLSAYWHTSRRFVMGLLPSKTYSFLPALD